MEGFGDGIGVERDVEGEGVGLFGEGDKEGEEGGFGCGVDELENGGEEGWEG